jgi:hypothetical protein
MDCRVKPGNDDWDQHRASIDCSAQAQCVRKTQMALNQTSIVRRRVVIDDRSRLPGRFFGRFATSATSELKRAQ